MKGVAAGLAGLLLGAVLAGCSDDGEDGGSGGPPSPSASAPHSAGPPSASSSKGSPSGSAPATPASVRDAQHALDTALGAVKKTSAYDIEHDDEGPRDWEIKLAQENGGAYDGKQYVVRVSDDGGKVKGKREQRSRDDDAVKLKDTKVTLKQAVQQASQHHQGQELASAEIDRNRLSSGVGREGTAVWQVRTANPASAAPGKGDGGDGDAAEMETVVDAETGRILTERRDD